MSTHQRFSLFFMQRLFIYGTLLQGEANAAMLNGASLLCPQRTAAGYQLVNLGPYPGMLAQGHGSVAGEVYGVPHRLWTLLDDFEDHPRVYVRTLVPLHNGELCH